VKKRSKGKKRVAWWAEFCRKRDAARSRQTLSKVPQTPTPRAIQVPVTPVDEEVRALEDVVGPASPDLYGPKTPASDEQHGPKTPSGDEEHGPKTPAADEEDGSANSDRDEECGDEPPADEVMCLLVSWWLSKLVMEELLATFMYTQEVNTWCPLLLICFVD